MKTTRELVEMINSGTWPSAHHIEDEEFMDGVKSITEIDSDERRWYIVATKVYAVGDEFIGIRGPVSLKSESMGFDDVAWACQAFEMVAVPSVTYEAKQEEN